MDKEISTDKKINADIINSPQEEGKEMPALAPAKLILTISLGLNIQKIFLLILVYCWLS